MYNIFFLLNNKYDINTKCGGNTVIFRNQNIYVKCLCITYYSINIKRKTYIFGFKFWF